MAKYVVPPRGGSKHVIIKCYSCGTMYVPDKNKHPYGDKRYYEACPICGTGVNSKENRISLWRYNLIKYWRGLFDHEQPDDSSTDD